MLSIESFKFIFKFPYTFIFWPTVIGVITALLKKKKMFYCFKRFECRADVSAGRMCVQFV